MKVLQLSKFYPPHMGGIESVTWELTEGLARAGVSVDVLCANQGPRGSHEAMPSGYGVRRVGSWGRLQSTSIAPGLIAYLARMVRGVDVLHVHMPDPMAALAIYLVRPRCAVLLHWHSDVVRQRTALRVYAPLQQWLLNRADAVIATSSAYAEASTPLKTCAERLEVIPIGISDRAPLAHPGKVREIRQRHLGRRLVFGLGRLTYYKGFDTLIEAAQHLPDDVVVLIGGDGDMRNELSARIQAQGLTSRVQLLGRISDEELPSYLAACDVFCMPSTLRAEAFGVAMVEAMMMGKPVVACLIPGSGVPWVNHHEISGLNVEPGDAAALADALHRLLVDTAMMSSCGKMARLRYESEFSAELMVRRTLALYRRVIDDRRSLHRKI